MAAPNASKDILNQRRVIVGVTGCIAAYKACSLVTHLCKRGAEVRVVMTRAATEFVTPTTFAALSGREVAHQMFGVERGDALHHVHLTDFAEVIVVAPATADILGKVAHGIADDLLSTTIMAAGCPVIFAPAMNYRMWQNPIVQENVTKLREYGYRFVMPEEGRLASGAEGPGRLARQEFLVAAVERALLGGKVDARLAGWKMVVSAGPTREFLDPVRFLSNPSSGRMGYAIAEEAASRGAEVTLVTGPTALPPPSGLSVRPVVTCAEMKQVVLEAVAGADAFISAAAPADYAPGEVSSTKIKKHEHDNLTLRLQRTDDILAAVTASARPRLLVGFAAETGQAVEKAREKLAAKGLDLLVVNDVAEPGSGFGVGTNRVTILHRDGTERALPLMSKQAVAAVLLDEIASLQ